MENILIYDNFKSSVLRLDWVDIEVDITRLSEIFSPQIRFYANRIKHSYNFNFNFKMIISVVVVA